MSAGRRTFLQALPALCVPIPDELERRRRFLFELGGSRRIPEHLILELLEDAKEYPSVSEVFSTAQQAIQAQSDDRAFTVIVDDSAVYGSGCKSISSPPT